MPHHIGNVTKQTIKRNGASVVLMDYTGKRHSQFIRTAGGGVNGDAHKDLAAAIGSCSNAFVIGFSKVQEEEYRVSDAKYFDEADPTVESQLVIVFQHDTDPGRAVEVVIPAPDASLFLADYVTPDFEHPNLLEVVNKAKAIINDDGSLSPDNYHTYYGYKTTRKVGKRTRKVNLALPTPEEPDATDDPGGDPGNPPVTPP